MRVDTNSPLMQALGDKDKFVKRATEFQEKRLTEVKDQIKQSGEETQALATLKGLVQSYTKASASIISPVNNPFTSNKADIYTTENSPASNYIEVTTTAGASKDSFSARVNQLVTASKMVIEGPGNGGITENPGMDGTLTIVVSGVPSMIVIGTGDNASQIIDKINTQLTASGARAQAVPIKSNGVIYIEINHLDKGPNVMTFDWVPNGIIPPNTLAQRSNTNGQAAIIEVDGVQIAQNSNTFKDVLPGITVTALAPNTNNDATKKQTVTIVNDPTRAINEMKNFIDAYNNLAKFTAKMTEKVSKTEYAKTAVLHGTNEIIQAQALLDTLSTGIARGNYNFSSLSDIGLGLEDVTLPDVPAGTKLLGIIDPEKFTSAVKNDSDSLAALLRGKVDVTNNQANGGSVLRFSTMSKLLPTSVLAKNIAVTTTLGLVGGDVNAVTATIPGDHGGPATNVVGVYRVVGGYGYITFPNTVLAGLNLGYDPKGLVNRNENFTVSISQGLAESSFYNSINMVSENGASGSVVSAIEESSKDSEKLAANQKKLEDRIKSEVSKVDKVFSRIGTLDVMNNAIIDLVDKVMNPSK